MLLVSVILVSSYNYIDSSGSSIQCMIDKGTNIGANIINNYCWIMSTYTLPRHFNGTPGQDFLHHGVGQYIKTQKEFWKALLCYISGTISFPKYAVLTVGNFIWVV